MPLALPCDELKLALPPPIVLTLNPPPELLWCALLTVVSCTLRMFRLPPTSAVTVRAETFEPMTFVSPPLRSVTLFAPVTCELFCITASLLPSPCARDMAAEIPIPFVPIDTPTLALDDEFELRVESVFVVFCRSI
ncbi:hypothetical protein WT14_32045 [Burkholderia stagnalis]|nr:hypothetical protein WT07_00145 [Burkholderia stagnalis]KVN53252.1 hypothetical protein WT14_32045 [Burkholderia stagnalis]KWE00242.1 hypothetical protein WT47_24310 [Burkholderia stagnalis]KWE07572.1 hypothetical protein WT48_27465 [Burkholderia stagnalis]KWO77967.1 hypothetical protein WU00_09490 [Burkholderia stagnalis]